MNTQMPNLKKEGSIYLPINGHILASACPTLKWLPIADMYYYVAAQQSSDLLKNAEKRQTGLAIRLSIGGGICSIEK